MGPLDFSRTLIIKPSSMGDVVQALPVLTALREAHPGAYVAWLVARPFAGLLEGHPRLDELLVFDRHRFGRVGRSLRVTREFLAFMRLLRQKQFTVVFDLQGLMRSGLFALATAAPARVGFRQARELAPLAYTHKVPVPGPDVHAVDRYMSLAAYAGLPSPRATDHLPVSDESRQSAGRRLADEGLAAGEPYVVACADARWPSKRWPPERFAHVLQRVRREAGGRAVLVGSDAATALAGAVARAMAEPPIDLTGRTTLKELVAVIAGARVMLTNDSGPMHVAAAVGTPVVAVFGPTNPARTGPYGKGHRVLARRSACSPCYRRECLLGGSAEALCCLMNIGADEVADHVLEVWRRPRPA